HFRELLAGNQPPSQEALIAAYQQEWSDREQQGVLIGKEKDAGLDALATRMLSAFRQSTVATPAGKVLAIEEELRGNLVPGIPDLLGKIDLIVETPQELVISDWKTSKSRWNEQQIIDGSEQL